MNFDQRVSREFDWGTIRLAVLVDVFNLLHSNRDLTESYITDPQFSRRVPLEVQSPRALRLGLRLSF